MNFIIKNHIYVLFLLLSAYNISAQITEIDFSKIDKQDHIQTSETTYQVHIANKNINKVIDVNNRNGTFATNSGVKLGTNDQLPSSIVIEFDKNIEKLIVPVSDFFSTNIGDNNPNRQLISVKGMSSTNDLVLPTSVSFSGSNQMINYSNGNVLINKSGGEDILFYFASKIKKIIISTDKENQSSKYNTFLKVNNFIVVDDEEKPKDTRIEKLFFNCQPINLIFILDASSSMSINERSIVTQKILKALQELEGISERSFTVSIVTFGRNGKVLLEKLSVDKNTVKPTGIISNLLENQYVHESKNNANNWTNWDAGLSLNSKLANEYDNSISYFITDGPPNGGLDSRITQKEIFIQNTSRKLENNILEIAIVGEKHNSVELWGHLLKKQNNVNNTTSLDNTFNSQLFNDLLFRTCSEDSDLKNINFKVSPNPNSGVFYIHFNNTPPENSKIIVLNSLGAVIHEIESLKVINYVDIANSTSPGMFYVALKVNGELHANQNLIIVK